MICAGIESQKAISNASQAYNEALLTCRSAAEANFKETLESLKQLARRMNLPSLAFAANRLAHFREHGIQSINVGGTMGSGKSSVAKFLADSLKFNLRDSDYFHTEEARQKMHSGIALSAVDRFPFLRDVRSWLATSGHITTCSALSDLYRAIISGQETEALINTAHLGKLEPWEISRPNLGLLQIIVTKPYDYALEELDCAENAGTPRLFDGKPHFIVVTKQTEEIASAEGRIPLLRSQYNLLESSFPYPWDAIIIDSAEMRCVDGRSYDPDFKCLNQLLKLPFAT